MKEVKNLQKLGNSVAVVIPGIWLKNQGLQEGDPIELDLQDDQLIIRKTKKEK